MRKPLNKPTTFKPRQAFAMLLIGCFMISTGPRVWSQDATSAPKDFVIKGRCLKYDLQNRPGGEIVDARVTLFTHRGRSMKTEQLQQVLTNKEGRFVFAPVTEPRGNRFTRRNYVLKIEAEGYAVMTKSVNDQQTLHGLSKYDIHLFAGEAVLRGRVVNEDGENISGATVEFWGAANAQVGGPIAITRSNGLFRLEGFPQIGSEPTMLKGASLVVRHPDYPIHFYTVEEEDTKKGAIRVVLPQGATLTGQVLDAETGSPLANLMVLAIDNYQSANNFVLTDKNGEYRLNLLEGRSQVMLEDESLVAKAQVFDCDKGDVLTAAPMLATPGGWIVGQVTDKRTGKPVSRAFDSDGVPNRVPVGCYGPARPPLDRVLRQDCLAEVDNTGRFRMRVYPGKNFPFINIFAHERRCMSTLNMPPVIVTAGEETVCDFKVEPFKQ